MAQQRVTRLMIAYAALSVGSVLLVIGVLAHKPVITWVATAVDLLAVALLLMTFARR